MNMIMTIIKIALCVCILLTGSSSSFGQSGNISKEELKSMTLGQRIYFGGIVGASFGTVTNIQLMPIAGYRILPRWSAGIGVNYQYFKDNRYRPAYETNVFGGNVHSRVFVYQNLFAHTEFEVLNFEVPVVDSGSYSLIRKNVPAWFVGAGYFLPIGQRSGMAVTFLYDLIQDTYSPYPANYTLRIGFVL
jgi:hypothetical protein